MPVIDQIGRRNAIPIIYVRGSHYDVGFDVGRTFSGIIQSFVNNNWLLNKIWIPLYKTTEGKKSYDATLTAMRQNYPQYIAEIEGTAEGSNVPFYKLFLLHMDDILPISIKNKGTDTCAGCSTVCCNQPNKAILGHNEDAITETLNHFYFVSAHIIDDVPQGKWKVKEEKFTSLCYAGTLPGFTMSYNHHGLVFSVNIVSAKNLKAGRTPRTFLTRSLLAAENFSQVQQMVQDSGTGIGDGVSINLTFLKEDSKSFHNIEVGPSIDAPESVFNIITAKQGENIYHTNRYLRLKEPEVNGLVMESSIHRHKTIDSLPVPKEEKDVINILGDESDLDFSLFRDRKDEDIVKTIATGIFDCKEMTWSIYTDNPKTNEPLLVLPMILKK